MYEHITGIISLGYSDILNRITGIVMNISKDPRDESAVKNFYLGLNMNLMNTCGTIFK